MATPESCSGHVDRAAAEEQQTWKGHVLVVPWPAQGHINPMMHLSSLLAAQGVLITFVNTQFNHERILQAQASSPEAHTYPAGNIRLVGLSDGLGYDEYVANFSVPKQAQALIDLEPSLKKLVEEAQPPVTCIIADFNVISTPAVARQFNIPHIGFWTQTATSYACHSFFTQNHAYLKDYLEKLCSEGRVDERVISCVPSCPTMSYKEVPTFLLSCDASEFLFSYLIENFQMAPHHTFVLINSFEKLEEESLDYIRMPNMLCIGPLLPAHFVLHDNSLGFLQKKKNIPTMRTSFWVEDYEGCLPWLHQQKPFSVLYVSFGSITLMSAQQIIEFAAGLETCGCPFLMVVRPEMMEGGGAITFPYGFIEKMIGSGQACFVPWAPQLEVLAHSAIGGFLTHAGWNSILESICRAVPMLCWPYFADQMVNARCIVETWKIGLEFSMKKVTKNEELSCANSDDTNSLSKENGYSKEVSLVTREEVEKKIRQLMDPLKSKEIRKRINSLSLAAKRKYETSSQSNIKLLVDVICK